MSSSTLIVAIDGPSGVGKTTIARSLAQRLGIPCLETGTMYRAFGWKVLRSGIESSDRQKVEELARRLRLELREVGDRQVEVRLDGAVLGSRLRSPEVSEITSVISSYSEVRQELVARQREFAGRRGAVVEGRDIGTRVFPDTPHKFFLVAPLDVRVARRVRQLEEAGQTDLPHQAIEAEVAARDLRDRRRADSPLRLDSSYTIIDTGALSVEEAVETMIKTIRGRSPSAPGSGERPGDS